MQELHEGLKIALSGSQRSKVVPHGEPCQGIVGLSLDQKTLSLGNVNDRRNV